MSQRYDLLRQLPKIDEMMSYEEIINLIGEVPRSCVTEILRECVEKLRVQLLISSDESLEDYQLPSRDEWVANVKSEIKKRYEWHLRPVINATGTILHTNLGRAKLSKQAIERVIAVSEHYSTLEYNCYAGERGSRHDVVTDELLRLTKAEAAMIVNNNAAAVLLCLSTMAKDKSVLVSRGELVEIGGSFRIPEIMLLSGAKIYEVGTTNKTHLEDYQKAMGEETGCILKVHKSNYEIIGFTEEVSLMELVQLAKSYNWPVIYDLGSGLLHTLEKWRIDEPTVEQAVKEGADVIMFSADKLFGGPQAGIIIGKKIYIDAMKKHPLARVVRADKLTLAALEGTLRLYFDQDIAKNEIPVLNMITIDAQILYQRCEKLRNQLLKNIPGLSIEIELNQSLIGGGTSPNQYLKGYVLVCRHENMEVEVMEKNLRKLDIPIITRIAKNHLLIDLRTVTSEEESYIISGFIQIMSEDFQ